MIPFLDVLLIRTLQKIHTTVYHKKGNTNLHIHWISTVFREIKNKQAYQHNISQDNNDEDQK